MTTQVWYLPTTTQAGKIPKLTQQVTREHEGPNADPHFHQLLRQKAFDESVLGNLINSETITLLEYIFAPTETARCHRITSHWTVDWDVATVMEALYYTEGVFMSPGWACCQFNVHIFSVFCRLYHINSETDMHIFSIFSRVYHINSQIFVYAFAPSRVLIH